MGALCLIKSFPFLVWSITVVYSVMSWFMLCWFLLCSMQ